jgi:hypothetical protein
MFRFFLIKSNFSITKGLVNISDHWCSVLFWCGTRGVCVPLVYDVSKVFLVWRWIIYNLPFCLWMFSLYIEEYDESSGLGSWDHGGGTRSMCSHFLGFISPANRRVGPNGTLVFCLVHVSINFISVIPLWAQSLIKWCLIAMCLALECKIGFLKRWMVLVLSQ